MCAYTIHDATTALRPLPPARAMSFGLLCRRCMTPRFLPRYVALVEPGSLSWCLTMAYGVCQMDRAIYHIYI